VHQHCHLLQMAIQIWQSGCFNDVPHESALRENRRLERVYLEEKLKAKIVPEALEKSGEDIPT
jgi:hypothetical protein